MCTTFCEYPHVHREFVAPWRLPFHSRGVVANQQDALIADVVDSRKIDPRCATRFTPEDAGLIPELSPSSAHEHADAVTNLDPVVSQDLTYLAGTNGFCRRSSFTSVAGDIVQHSTTDDEANGFNTVLSEHVDPS